MLKNKEFTEKKTVYILITKKNEKKCRKIL